MKEKRIILNENTHKHLSVFKAVRQHTSFDDAVTELLVQNTINKQEAKNDK